MNYYININGAIKGPYPVEKLLEEGVERNTMLCIEGEENWQRAENFAEVTKIWDKPTVENKAKPPKIEKSNKIESSFPVSGMPTTILDGLPTKEFPNDFKKTPNKISTKGIIVGIGLLLLIIAAIYLLRNDPPDNNIGNPPDTKITPDEMKTYQANFEELLMQGDAVQRDTTLAKKYFLEAFDLNRKIKGLNTKTMDSLATVYEKRAKKTYLIYKNTSSEYMTNRDYTYASILKGELKNNHHK